MLGQVKPDTVSAWVVRDKARVARGELPRLDVRYEGKRPLFLPAQIIELAFSLHERERDRDALKLSLIEGITT